MQGDIIDFEFVHNGVYPPECGEGCDSCGSECDEEEDEDEVTGLSFDMDLMDLFTKESGISISSEDFMCYLVSMEFISLCLSLSCSFIWTGKIAGRFRLDWHKLLKRFVIQTQILTLLLLRHDIEIVLLFVSRSIGNEFCMV